MANLKAQIHIAKSQLGLDDETYRDVLKGSTGKTSCAAMSERELKAALQAFKERGFKSRPPRKTNSDKSKGTATLEEKLIAIWRSMANDGLLNNCSDAALRSYVRRQTGNKFEAPQFCDNKTLIRLIESLKQWRKRIEREQEAEVRRQDGRRFGLAFRTEGPPPKQMSKIMWRIQEERRLVHERG